MITILAATSIPLITRQMRDRRTQEAAQRVASLYRDARMRAMGRGSAMLVRYTPGTRGRFEIREAQRGSTDSPTGSSSAACSALPVSSCLTPDWNGAVDDEYRILTYLDLANRGEYDRLNIDLLNESKTPLSTLDICFTPMGRAFSRSNLAQNLQPLTSAHVAEVYRAEGSNRLGRTRRVLILPTGSSRIYL